MADRRRAPALRSPAGERARRASSSRAGCATAPRSCSTRRPRSRTTLAATWGAARPGRTRRGSRCRSSGCSRTPRRGTVLAARRRPTTPTRRCSRRARSIRSSATSTGSRARINGLQQGRLPRARRGRRQRLEDAHRADPRRGRRARRRRRRAARPRRGASRRAPRARSPKPTSPAAGACTARRAARAKAPTTTRVSRTGDFVVHRVHGIGRYLGMETREMFGVTRDRLVVEFKGGDRVYVDSEDIGLIRKYTGGEEPKLSKMGGADWEKTRARVRKAVRDIAAELVILYRQRLATPGHAFARRRPVPAADRGRVPVRGDARPVKAIEETKADMERSDPDGPAHLRRRRLRQDRGRAARRGQGRVRRHAGRGARADDAAREPARADVPRAVRELSGARRGAVAVPQRQGAERGRQGRRRTGTVDIVIGTHRLLSDDIEFKNLGLLVVDEEQRFGVQHKERIKKLRTDVDVLTLSATPIPRTLEMSLTGIRDLSLVQTPPEDRQPILTYVGEYDARAVSEAIRRELLREGQVLFVHNRVTRHRSTSPPTCASSCPTRASRSRTARWTKVSSNASSPSSGSASTTCSCARRSSRAASTCRRSTRSSSTGPTCSASRSSTSCAAASAGAGNARTRTSSTRPTARSPKQAYERLKTIGEFTDLGSGFKIAMRDLEIRGAGNLLGAEQSGHIAAVGFDLYMEMVTEAVGELTGEVRRAPDRGADRPADHRAPAARLHRARRRAHGGVPPARRGHERRRRRRRPRRVARPLRPAADSRPSRCSTSPGCAPRRCGSASARCRCRRSTARFDGLELRKSQEARLQADRPASRACSPDAVVVPVETGDASKLDRRVARGCSP